MGVKDWIQHRLLSLAGWDKLLDLAAFGEKSDTGLFVNEQTAMRNTAVFACVRIVAETVASLPLNVYQRIQPRGKERASNHRLYDILHDQPNPEMTSFSFWEALIGHLMTWGNAYAEIEFDMGTGQVKALWPLRPDKMKVERQNGQLIYVYKLPNGQHRILESFRVLHIPGFGFDGLMGYSPIAMAREAVGLAMATEKFGAKFFGNGAKPGGVLQTTNILKDDAYERLKKNWSDTQKGLDNSHRVAILEQGMSYQQIGIPPEDAQFLETRKFQITEIARIYRMQLHKLQEMDSATFSNIEMQSIEHVVDTIRPYTVRIEKAIKMKLFGPEEKKVFFAEFLLDGLLRGDTASRFSSYAIGRQWGWLSANDIRELENQNPIGDEGDMYLVPMNMIPADQAALPPARVDEPTNEPEEDARALEACSVRSVQVRNRLTKRYAPLFRDAGQRIVSREAADIRKAVKRFIGERDSADFLNWLEEFYRKAPSWITRLISPTISNYAEAVQAEAADEISASDTDIRDFVNDYIGVFAERYVGSSLGQIQSLVAEALEAGEDPAEVVDERLTEWEEKRPDKIATTETIRGGAAFALATYAVAGITRKRWVTVGDNCPYCRSMGGKVIGIERDFASKDDSFQPEGAERPLTFSSNIGNPPLHSGCDCSIAADRGSRSAAPGAAELRSIYKHILGGAGHVKA